MASTQLKEEVQDARALAHKIWLECHNGRSQYHCLANDVRNMRNVLEDIEEITAGQIPMTTEDTAKLQEGVTSCSSALCILEFSLFALQRSRHSFNFSKSSGVLRNLKPVAVATLQRLLLASTAEAHSALAILPARHAPPTQLTGRACLAESEPALSPANTLEPPSSPSVTTECDPPRAGSRESPPTKAAESPLDAKTAESAPNGHSTQPSSPVRVGKRSPPPVPDRKPTFPPVKSPKPHFAAADPQHASGQGIEQSPSSPHRATPPSGRTSHENVQRRAGVQHAPDLGDVLMRRKELKPVAGRTASATMHELAIQTQTAADATDSEATPDAPILRIRIVEQVVAEPEIKPSTTLHASPTPFVAGTADQEVLKEPATSCGLDLPCTARDTLEAGDIQEPSTEMCTAPTSRLVQRLKSNAHSPSPSARGSLVSPKDASERKEQPAVSTVVSSNAVLGNRSVHTLSNEDLYSSSRPTTPRVSADCITDGRAERNMQHRSSLAQPDLEVDQRSDEERVSSQLSFRSSDEEILATGTSRGDVNSDTHLISITTSAATLKTLSSQPIRRPPPPPVPASAEITLSLPEKDYSLFRPADAVHSSSPGDTLIDINEERITRLGSYIATDQPNAARRVRHLLGVCASFQGHWQRALVLFTSILTPAIDELSDLDPADCAALWWLADTYVLLGRQAEALLAYCMALQGYTSSCTTPHAVVQCLRFDQQFIKISRSDFRSQWDAATDGSNATADDTIFNTKIFSQTIVKKCFDAMALDVVQAKHSIGVNRNRASLLHQFDGYNAGSVYSSARHNFQHISIAAHTFDADAAWPMRYDPLFSIANVARGRLVERPCNVLEYVASNPHLDFTRPRAGVWAIGRRARFKCDELIWLLGAVRSSLEVMGIEWSETADPDTFGLCFLARHSLVSNMIATTDYFTISLFRHSLHSKYSVAVCTDGIRSARINTGARKPRDAVKLSKKRLEKVFYRYLKQAYAERMVQTGAPAPKASDKALPKLPPRPPATTDMTAGHLEQATFLAASESLKEQTTMLVIQPIGPGTGKGKQSAKVRPAIAKPSRTVTPTVKA